jgi:hypothetical protein
VLGGALLGSAGSLWLLVWLGGAVWLLGGAVGLLGGTVWLLGGAAGLLGGATGLLGGAVGLLDAVGLRKAVPHMGAWIFSINMDISVPARIAVLGSDAPSLTEIKTRPPKNESVDLSMSSRSGCRATPGMSFPMPAPAS